MNDDFQSKFDSVIATLSGGSIEFNVKCSVVLNDGGHKLFTMLESKENIEIDALEKFWSELCRMINISVLDLGAKIKRFLIIDGPVSFRIMISYNGVTIYKDIRLTDILGSEPLTIEHPIVSIFTGEVCDFVTACKNGNLIYQILNGTLRGCLFTEDSHSALYAMTEDKNKLRRQLTPIIYSIYFEFPNMPESNCLSLDNKMYSVISDYRKEDFNCDVEFLKTLIGNHYNNRFSVIKDVYSDFKIKSNISVYGEDFKVMITDNTRDGAIHAISNAIQARLNKAKYGVAIKCF